MQPEQSPTEITRLSLNYISILVTYPCAKHDGSVLLKNSLLILLVTSDSKPMDFKSCLTKEGNHVIRNTQLLIVLQHFMDL